MEAMYWVAALSLLAMNASAQSPDAREVLIRSDDPLLKAPTMRLKADVDFQMSVRGVEVKAPVSLDVAMATGRRFRYEVGLGENRKLTVSDGKTTWIYTPSSKIYTVTQGSSGGPAPDMQNIVYGKAAANITLAEALRVESIAIDARNVECYVVRGEYPRLAMFPNSGVAVRTVWIGRESGLIWRDIWEGEASLGNPPAPSHVRVTYNYSVLEYGAPLADDLFIFHPPEGAKPARTFVPPTAVIPSNPLGVTPNLEDPVGKLGGVVSGGGVGSGSGGGIGAGVYRAGNGVSKPELLSKVEPEYSEQARQAKVQGVVVLYIVVDQNGNVLNPRITKSLGLGLDEKALEAVRQWKFKPGFKDGQPVAVAATIEVNFRLLNSEWLVTKTAITARESDQRAILESMPPNRSCSAAGTVTLFVKVNTGGEVSEARALSTTNVLANEAALSFARKLRFRPSPPDDKAAESEGEIGLECPGVSPPVVPKQIAAITESELPPTPGIDGGNRASGPITIPGSKQAAKLLQHSDPMYPDAARQGQISGTVRLRAVIATDGSVKELSVIEGHPLLRGAAIDAVKHWRYAPTLLDGQPVEVITEVDVIFSLGK